MSAINNITESWNNHTFQEVETHIKGSYLPLTSVSVDSISSGVANVLTLNSSNAVKKTSLSDLASLLGGQVNKLTKYPDQYSNIPIPGFTTFYGVLNGKEGVYFHWADYDPDGHYNGVQLLLELDGSSMWLRGCLDSNWSSWLQVR